MPIAKSGTIRFKGDPMSMVLSVNQCAEMTIFLRALKTYHRNTEEFNIGWFLDKYREATTTYKKKSGAHIPLSVGICAWGECNNEFRFEAHTHQKYCCKSCARKATLAKKKEYKKGLLKCQNA